MVDEPDWGTSPDRPLEIAQLVWIQALGLDRSNDPADAMALVQLASNDRSVVEHALSHGRGRDHDSDDETTTDAVDCIERARLRC